MQEAGPISYGAVGSIGATALPLTSTSSPMVKGVYISCPSTNSGPIYVGDSAVTASNGLPVAAGATSPLIPASDASKIYVVSGGTGQAVRWLGA
jgi:hypothetical protein